MQLSDGGETSKSVHAVLDAKLQARKIVAKDWWTCVHTDTR